MKKIILLIILILALSLSSCKTKKPDADTQPTEPTFWDGVESVTLVSSEDSEWSSDFSKKLAYAIGLDVNLRSEVTDSKCQIIIGKSDNAVSVKAYELLERKMTDSDDNDAGYLVYVDEKTVAIAFQGISGRNYAIDALLKDHFTEKFDPSNGTLCYSVYSMKALADNERAAQREEQISEIEATNGKPMADAIRKLYSLFNADTYIWMANLYDPETGAFYYSNSGRDNIGFLPDVESTQQILGALVIGGMLREQGGITGALSPEMEDKLVGWIRSLQSPEDGYFYHPQWGTDVESTRRSRDLDWSISLLESFGALPLYDTPTGVKGVNGAGGISPTSSPLRHRSLVTAVSSVISTAGGALPEYLSSTSAFREYIISLDIPNNSYAAGNKLAADHALIKSAGKEYVDILINYLNETQIPELGLWQATVNDNDFDPYDGVGYDSVNGLMKLTCVYDFLGREMPNIDKALESAIKVGLYRNTDTDEHVCCTYNPWATMDMLIRFETKARGFASAEVLRKKIIDVAPELIEATYDKISTHYILGGGFSYNESRPCNASQGAYTACSSVPEADVNATAVVASNMISTMFYALGIERVFLWCPDDFYVFRDVIENLGMTMKHELPEITPITFEGYEKNNVISGSELDPAENVMVDVGEFEYFSSTVVNRPYSSSKKDMALRTEVKNTDVGIAYKPSSTNIYIANSFQQGNCFIFESDILVESSTNDVFAQILFSPLDEGNPSFGLNLSATNQGGKQVIKIWDAYTGTDGIKNSNLYTGVGVGEWFNLRIEMYKVFEKNQHGVSELKENYAKIYVNGEHVATSDAGYVHSSSPGVVKNREVAKVSISHYRKTQSIIYFDNILCKKTNDEYVPTTIYNPDAPNLPDVSVDEGEDYNFVAEFDDGILNDAYLHSYIHDGGLVNVMKEGIDLEEYSDRISYALASNIGDRVGDVLRITTKKQTAYGVSSSIVRVSNTLPKGTTYTFESKMYYENIAERGCVTQLHFKDADGRIHLSLNVMYSDEGYIYLSENNSTGTGQQKPFEGANFALEKWFTLRIEFYRTTISDTTRVKIYSEDAEGDVVCIADINAYNASAIGSETPLTNVEIAHQRLNAATLYLDDVSFTRREIDYEEETVYPIAVEDVLQKVPDEPDAPDEPEQPDEPVAPPPSTEDDSGEHGGALTPDNVLDPGAWT